MHGCIDLLVVVATGHLEGLQQLLIAPVSHAVQEAMLLEDVLADDRAVGLGVEPLAITVGGLLERLDELAVVVSLDQFVELPTPDELDDVETSAAEGALELLNDLGIPAHGTIQPLVVAVHDEDHVVEPLAARNRDGRDGLRLVHLAITHEGPDTTLGGVREASQVQVAEEACLVNRAQGPKAHGHGGVLPEVRHQPRVRVTGHALAARLTTEVHDLVDT
mmetsp:Transcript_49061/g.110338  ORF Transcript_49061/g.110338 Transcript_49061/m.110338 type:complete len:220 (-) Transcript_49061:1053-1712(-)